MSIYMNNAATTWPKPSLVGQRMSNFLTNSGANIARGSASRRDLDTMDMVITCRETLGRILGGYENGDPRYVTFTANVTESLNVVLKGFLRSGMTVVTTSMEHNAVIRPLRRLERQDVKVVVLPCDRQGRLNPNDLRNFLDDQLVDMVVMAHASNVCGVVQDLKTVSSLCVERGVPLVVDTAQTAGVLNISASELGISALCWTGHKGLMGPQGIGGILWDPGFASRCESLIDGGTGSFSHEEVQPTSMPDAFESGTLNLPGIAGLLGALEWLEETGISSINHRETALGNRLFQGLLAIPDVVLYGPESMSNRLPVFSLNIQDVDNGILAQALSEQGIETRPGLHCAPLAHRTLGSFPQGSLRLSIGYFTSEEDVDKVLSVFKDLILRGI